MKDLRERTVSELQELMRAGTLTSERLVAWYLERIEKFDRGGPKLRSVIAVSPDALAQASLRDRQREAGNVLGPLHGIPVLVKDNIETKELPTTAGSLALQGSHTGRDADVVAALREAGAVILGKANLSEWANFRGKKSTSGWSAVGGQTLNPYDANRSPCGSSSGSAVAVSANFAAVALGTETDGSIVCPASVSGVVGFKPSRGRLSSKGIVPISDVMDTAGPIARTVSDVALTFVALAGAEDAALDASNVREALSRASLQGKRLGVVRLASGKELEPLFDARLDQMRTAGAELVDIDDTNLADHFERESGFLLHHFERNLDAYFATRPNSPFPESALRAIIDFNRSHSDQELEYFGQELFEEAVEKSNSKELDQAGRALIDELRKLWLQKFTAHRLDAIVMVTTPKPPKIDPEAGDDWPDAPPASTYAAVTGFPHVTVPMGLRDGLPGGLSFIGATDADVEVLAIARAYERLAKPRVPPQLE